MAQGRLMQKGIIFFGIMILGLTAVQAQEKDVVAKIGERVITTAEFDKMVMKKTGNRPVDRQVKEGLLTNLVQTVALSEAAKKKGLDKRKDVQELLALTQDNLLANELIKEEVINKISLDEGQVKKYYEQNIPRFKTPDQVRVGTIMIKMNAPAREEDKIKAREKAALILKKIKAGEDFAKLAEEFSDDPASRAKGGDLGFLPKGQQAAPFEKAVEQAVLALKPGETSEALETPFGFRIIKIGEEKKGEIQTFESVKDQARAMALEEAKKEKIKALVDQALKETGAQIYSAGLK